MLTKVYARDNEHLMDLLNNKMHTNDVIKIWNNSYC